MSEPKEYGDIPGTYVIGVPWEWMKRAKPDVDFLAYTTIARRLVAKSSWPMLLALRQDFSQQMKAGSRERYPWSNTAVGHIILENKVKD